MMISKTIDIHQSAQTIIYYEDNISGVLKNEDSFKRWINDLRKNDAFIQLFEHFCIKDDPKKYCVIGVLLRKKINKIRDLDIIEFPLELEKIYLYGIGDIFNKILVDFDGKKYSLDSFIIELNDSAKLSFKHISYILEYIDLVIKEKDYEDVLSTLRKENREWELLLF